MNKVILTLLLFCFSVTNSSAQFRKLEKRNHSVNKSLNEILAFSDFKTADFGFLAVDNTTGEIIAEHHSNKSLIPASTQKLITTAAALELYGPEFQFKTTLQYTGYIDTVNLILEGNIIIKGGGDPTLGSKYFESTKDTQFIREWSEAIKKLGIDSIAGAVIADASIYGKDIVPSTWSWNNMGNYFGAGACGLSVFDNYYTVYYNTSDQIGDTVEIIGTKPEIPGLVFDNSVVVDSVKYDNSNIYGAPFSDIRYLRGKLPPGKENYGVKGSMPDPAYIVAIELEKALKLNNIKIRDNATTVRISGSNIQEGKVIYKLNSPALSKIIRETNTHSINLYAEHLLNHCGLKLSGNPKTENAAKEVIAFWKGKGIDTQGMFLLDGSGLSRYDGFTPQQIVGILSYMKNNSQNFDVFYKSLPIAGETGTMKNMFKESIAKGKLRAKSGTVNRVKAYAGYVTSVSGREIVFSMVVNDFSCSSRETRAQLVKLMNALSEFDK